jgi:trimethylamine--corrinoid protein Co-methyltransferase
MRVRFSVLSQDDRQMIDRAALVILEKVGVQVRSSSLFRLLRKAGLPSDEASQTVCFPSQTVNDALAAVPKQWTQTDQMGKPLPSPADQPFFIARVLLNWVLDFGHREPRLPKKQDIVNLIRLSDSLPKSHIVFKVDCPCSDVAEELTYLETIAAVYKNTHKHILANPINLEATRYYVDLGEAATGESIAGQTWLLCGIAVTSPLTIDRDTGDSLVFLLERGAPINCFAMPIAGASGPVTLAGTVAQHTAEVLALVTAIQILNPGTPVGYGGMSTTLNLKTGNLSMAAPAVNLLTNAITTMATHYGLPAYNAANYTDAFVPDVQCGVEKAMSAIAGMAAGSTVGMFAGDLHDAMTVSYEQLLIDYDIWESVSRLMVGIQVDSETLAQEVIERIGHTGDMLTDPHTLSWLRRDEHVFGQFFVRGERQAEKSMVERAHQRVNEVLSEKADTPVSPDVIERIDAYVRQEGQLIQNRQR